MCEDRITPVLQSVLDVVEAQIEECDLPDFCRVGLVGGGAAWDDCCDCGRGNGQLWVRLVDWQPDPAFEQPLPSGCEQPTLLTVGVGWLRCVPVVDEQGHAPSAAQDTAAAMRLHHDTQVIYDAVMCGIEERIWQGWVPLGYEGGCGGGEHVFQIPHAACNC